MVCQLHKVPSVFYEAIYMYGLDKQRWKQAIQEEIDSINKNSAWKLTIDNHQKSYSRLEVIIHKKKYNA